ncbi:MAG: flagellar FlaF family protein, partial [Sphingomonadales bacterium]|nr:flagellar FlaF family protein [Sphingomonadales bacterium]
MSLNAYQKVQIANESPRQTEYRLFTEVTRALIEARDRGEKDKVLFNALDWNRRMWSTLSADCGIEGNG